MKRVFALNGSAVVREVPIPELRPGEVLIRTAYSAVSVGTETHIIDSSAPGGPEFHEYPESFAHPQIRSTGASGDEPEPRLPVPGLGSLGYSVAGRVEALGAGVRDLKPGDRVAGSGSQCAHHAEFVAVPRNLVARVPDSVGLDAAAPITLGTIAIEALRRTEADFGSFVVMYGLGLLGLLSTQIARAAGMVPLGIDRDAGRRALALTLGAEEAIDSETPGVVDRIRDLTNGFGADAVIVSVVSDDAEPLNRSFDMCRQRGRVVGLGHFGWDIDRNRMFANDVTIHPAIAYGPGRYDPVYEEGNQDYPIGYVRWTENRNQGLFLRYLAQGDVRIEPLTPIRVPIDDAPGAYELLRSAERPPTVLFSYGQPA